VNIQTSPLSSFLAEGQDASVAEGKASPVTDMWSRIAEDVLQDLELAKTLTVKYTTGNSAEGSGVWQKMLSGKSERKRKEC
jgi:hypothetical protein